MNTMNLRRLSILLLVAICLSLFACTGGTTENESTQGTEKESITSSPAESDKEETTDNNGGDRDTDSESKPKDTESKGEESESEDESETEDPRLSAEYAPVTYFGAKDIYELTKEGVYEEMAQLFFGYDEVTYHKEEGKRPYTKILTYNDYQTAAEAYISLCTSPMEVAPIFAVKYRTTTPGIGMEIYTDSVNLGVTGGNNIRIPVTSDGEWHVEYVNLSRISAFNGQTVNYFRFDFMNASVLPVDSYVDFEYIGFFSSEDYVEMFETGKYSPTIYVDPSSGFKESTTIVHASSIDMINGAGGIGATRFDYRGGNSSAGVDKFNHNGTTLSNGLLVFSGWTVVDGGIERFVWSIDGINWYDAKLHQAGRFGDLNQDHINATEKYTGAKVADVANSVKGGGYQGNINVPNPEDRARGLACELLTVAEEGQTVNVRFAAIPKNAPDELCLIAYVKGVTVVSNFEYEEETEETEVIDPTVDPEDCEAHQSSIYWYPIEGQLKEKKVCVLCGTELESRDPAYYSSFDIIEHNGSNITGGYGSGILIEKDGSAIVLRTGYDFVVQGWFACNGGVKDYMYSVDGGETWLVCGNSDNLVDKFKAEHKAAINKADLGITNYDVKGMYRLNLPLRQFAGETESVINVLFGACPANNPTVIITIANIKNVKIPAAPENDENTEDTGSGEATTEPPATDEEVEFIKAIDKLIIGGETVDNPAGGYGNKLFTYDASGIKLSNTIVTWMGWSGVNDGYSKWVYSIDDGKTWTDVTGVAHDITRADILGAITNAGFINATAKGMLSISADLSVYAGQTLTVIFGGVPNSNTNIVCSMVKIANVKVEGECSHADVDWSCVMGELKESGVCKICGETATRSISFLNNIDRIEGATVVNPPDGVNLLSQTDAPITSRDGKDIVFQGWIAINGGVQKYVYSLDGGETWLDCGNQPNYSGSKFMDSKPHQDAVNGANLGFTAADADVNAIYRVNCNLASKAGETVEVLFGIILENNPTAPAVQLLKVTVTVVSE